MAGDIEREDRGDVSILSVPARLDTLLSEDLERICTELADEGRFRLVVDCTPLEFLNSIVIKVLIAFHQQAVKNAGGIKLANVSLPVEDVLHLTKLDQIFSWYPSVDEAIEAF